ncbi:MAG: phosphatidate cytidylyltransferase [Planctomycetes bacterium]|nr:phosphatidate cytidylyltransferase [Planctomycetota bacterium]
MELAEAVRWAIAAVFAALLVASAVAFVLRRLRPHKDWTELRRRIASWWVMSAVFTAAIVLSRGTSIVFFAAVSYLALKEYFSLIPVRRADRRVLFWAYLTIPVQFYWVHLEWYGMFIVFVPVYAFLLIPLRMITLGRTEGFLRAAGTIHWGLMLMVFSLSHAAFLLVLQMPATSTAAAAGSNVSTSDAAATLPGPGLVVFLVVLTELNDVAQFLWGKSLGGRKIVPSVSPGKTWAGFLGGVATTVGLAALCGPWLTPMDRVQSTIAGAIIGLAGFVGDVNISALKRDLGIKDSGSLLPGHGGILDRVDSLTYTAPLFFHYVYWLFVFHTHGAAPVPPP